MFIWFFGAKFIRTGQNMDHNKRVGTHSLRIYSKYGKTRQKYLCHVMFLLMFKRYNPDPWGK